MRRGFFLCAAAFMLLFPIALNRNESVQGKNAVIADKSVIAAVTVIAEESVVPETESEPVYQTVPESVTVLDTDSGECFTCATEDYIIGVVAAEMPYTFHEEALKAQAVAARSYMTYRLEHNGAAHKDVAAVCTDSGCCKAYLSREDAVERWGEDMADRVFASVEPAVRATAGEIMLYEGEPVCAVFHSSSDGRTESSVNVWGGDLPYLTGCDTAETAEVSSVVYSAEEIRAILRENGYEPTDEAITPEYNENGRVSEAEVFGVELKGTELRTMLGLKSAAVTVTESEDGYVFSAHGYGHGVGMSQYGAQAMAESGADYRAILAHYYKGVEYAG